jgi:hypothetical protein
VSAGESSGRVGLPSQPTPYASQKRCWTALKYTSTQAQSTTPTVKGPNGEIAITIEQKEALAYEASLSFESPPRVERCIEVFEYLPPSLLSSFLPFDTLQVEKEPGNKQGILEVTSYPVDVPQGRQIRHWEFNI